MKKEQAAAPKRKKLPTRRKRALKRLLIAALAMLLVNHFMLLGQLLPIQAIRQVEERQGTGRTRVVTRLHAPEIYTTMLLYLTENENTTLLADGYLSIYGWMAGFGTALDCTEDDPLYAGMVDLSHDDGNVSCFFGRVDDPNIETVAVILFATEVDEMSHLVPGEEIGRLIASELFEKEGRRYFLLRDDGRTSGERRPIPVAIGYDSAGNEIARMEIEHGRSSFYG